MKANLQQPYEKGCKVTNPNECYYFGCEGVQQGCPRLKAIFPFHGNNNQEEK